MIRKEPQKKGKQVKVTFVLPDDHPHGALSAVGDFNDWDPSAHPFKRRSNNTFSTNVVLDAGRRYAFRYRSESGDWVNDDEADGYEPNGYGSLNCVLLT